MSNESTPNTPAPTATPATETPPAAIETKPSEPAEKSPIDGKAAPLAATEPSPTPTEKKKYKVKVDKDELEVEEDELIRNYQLRQASDKRFKEASARHKEAESFLELLKTKDGLKKVLSHPDVGQDVYKMAEELLAEKLEEEFMDPKEKEIRDLRREKAEREETEKQKVETARQAKEAEEIKGFEAAYVNDIESTIKTSGLPMNVHTINAVRDYMLLAMEKGNDGVKAADVIADVKADYQDAVKSLFSSSDIAAIVSIVGEESLKKLRDFDIGRLKNPKEIRKVAKEDQPLAKQERLEKPFVTVDQYFENLKKKLS